MKNKDCCNTKVYVTESGCGSDPIACEENKEVCITAAGENTLYVQLLAAFNMPACGVSADITVSDASRLAPGMLLYAPVVGYLEITAVKDSTTITVRNNCLACNIEGGEIIAQSVVFFPGIPTCTESGGTVAPSINTPFLASDFLVPSVGSCVNVKTTNVFGLSIGDIVAVAGGNFRVGGIIDSTTIQLCNDSQGGEVNTLIKWDVNGDAQPDYPVLRIQGPNPCLETPVQLAQSLLGCDGSQQKAVGGLVNNQVPVWNQVNQRWELKVLDDLFTCVTTASCLTLDPEGPDCQSYVIDVSPGNAAIAAELIKVTPNPLKVAINDLPFCVTQVIGANQVRVIPQFEFGVVIKIETGAVLCVQPCCDQCTPVVEVMRGPDGASTCQEEILIGTGAFTIAVGAGPGWGAYTLPSQIGVEDLWGFEPNAESMWTLTYKNEDCCDCRKFVEIDSNFEAVCAQGADFRTNLEFRMVKTAPIADSVAHASFLFDSENGFTTIAPPLIDKYLFPGFGSPATWKGGIRDSSIVNAGDNLTYKGHVRVVVYNPTVEIVSITLAINWRIKLKAFAMTCASVETTP